MKNINIFIKQTIFILILLSFNTILAEDWKKLLDLKGYWKFTIGDDIEWADYDYDDSDWDEIRVPSAWEDEGYYDYNGYAWYRKSFTLNEDFNSKSIYIHLGYVDDVDEVYINGKLISGSGSFPPNFQTAYNADRKYAIPRGILKTDEENVIAVRVYDARLTGGIHYGDVSLRYMNTFEIVVNLEGWWKFKTGDNEQNKEVELDDSNWDEMIVPSKWESNGYPDYNGFAWYRKDFFLQNNLKGEKLVLIMGKIDDLDECFINGKFVGSTGDMIVTPKFNDFDHEWSELRGYYIPTGVLKFNENNIIAVRVYDGYLDGGIYQGPIGITTQEIYRKAWKEKSKKKSIWEILFD